MKKIIFLLVFINLVNRVHAQNEFTKHFKVWLGSWEMNTAKDIIIEKWIFENDSTYIGKSVSIKPNGDSLLQETIELKFVDEQIYYIPKVVNQNNNEPIPFTLIEFNDNYFVFENKLHDFPQKITYDFSLKDHLKATIEGVRSKIRKKIDYEFKRIQ